MTLKLASETSLVLRQRSHAISHLPPVLRFHLLGVRHTPVAQAQARLAIGAGRRSRSLTLAPVLVAPQAQTPVEIGPFGGG